MIRSLKENSGNPKWVLWQTDSVSSWYAVCTVCYKIKTTFRDRNTCTS